MSGPQIPKEEVLNFIWFFLSGCRTFPPQSPIPSPATSHLLGGPASSCIPPSLPDSTIQFFLRRANTQTGLPSLLPMHPVLEGVGRDSFCGAPVYIDCWVGFHEPGFTLNFWKLPDLLVAFLALPAGDWNNCAHQAFRAKQRPGTGSLGLGERYTPQKTPWGSQDPGNEPSLPLQLSSSTLQWQSPHWSCVPTIAIWVPYLAVFCHIHEPPILFFRLTHFFFSPPHFQFVFWRGKLCRYCK